MTEVSIRDLTAEGSLAYYTIKVKDFIYDGYASTLEGAFEMISHNLKYDYREYERDLEYQRELNEDE
jgi:hypothetical protein